MPRVLDDCTTRVLADWKADPSKAPKKDKDGKPINTPERKRSVAIAICTASLQKAGRMSYDDEAFYLAEDVVFDNPVWTSFAFTNKPHIMGLDEMSFVDTDGNPWTEESVGDRLLKVPMLILGRWRHRLGVLDFTEKFVKRLETNFKAGLAGQKISGDAKHKDIVGSVAWAVGKFLLETKKNGLKQWSAIVKPTKPGAQLVEDEIFKYASVEFHPAFRSRLESAALSTDGIIAFLDEDCVVCEEIDWTEFYEEGNMPDGVQDQGNDQGVRLSEMESQLADMQAKLEQARATATSYQQLAWDQSVKRIELEAQARRDDQGRALPNVFLEFLRDTLRLESFKLGEQEISLERDNQDAGQVHAYYRSRIVQLARDLPGYVPMEESDSEPDKEPKIGQGDEDGDKALLSLDDSDTDLMWQNAS